MKKLRFYQLLFFLAMFYAKSYGQFPSNDGNWEIVFSDDFISFDYNRWNIANNYDHGGEPQIYTNRPNNIYIDNGNLVLKILKEDYNGHSYTSGWIQSKINYLYGYYEIRCKMPQGKGFWPAFWLWSANGECNTGGWYNEIDIFEMDGSNTTKTTNNLHFCNEPNLYQEQVCPNYSTNYHTYGAEWTPNKIVWNLDNQSIRAETNSFGITHPLQIVTNLAIFPWDLPDINTPFPSYMYIDYIKVYRLKMDCNTVIDQSNFNFNSYNYGVKKSVTLRNSSIPQNSRIIIRATDFIELQSGFEVPLGSEFAGIPTACY